VTGNVFDLPIGAQPDPDESVRAAMDWHFNPEWDRHGAWTNAPWTRTGSRGT
jgi:hypothetical protein